MRRAITLLVTSAIAAACAAGCLFPSLDGLSGDASATSDATNDAVSDVASDVVEAAPPRCNSSKPFSAPIAVPGINTSGKDITARYGADELTVVFTRLVSVSDAGLENYDLFMATRPTKTAAFNTPVAITEINSPAGDYDPFLMSDNLTLYFASDRPTETFQHIYVAKRATTSSPFGAPVDVTALDNAASYVGQPYFSPETTIYIADTDQGGVFVSTGQDETFTAPLLVSGLPSTGFQFPVLSGDSLTMFLGGAGEQDDVFVTTRSSVSAPFDAITAVTELNTSSDDDPTWLSADGCVLLIMSNRNGGNDYDIYSTQRGM